jgi:DNA-binding transcriptional ArsR family regulator
MGVRPPPPAVAVGAVVVVVAAVVIATAVVVVGVVLVHVHACHYVRMSARMHLSSAHGSHPRHPSAEQYALAAEAFALLADRTRLQLLHTLGEGEADVGTLTERCGAARPAVSQHLAKLRLAGLVTVRKEGRRMVYGLADGHLRRVVDEALNLADHRLSGERPHD